MKPFSSISEFVLIGLNYDHKPCFVIVLIADCGTDIYMFAMTTGKGGADSNHLPILHLVTRNDGSRSIKVPDLPGPQQSLNKGDFWRFNFKSDIGFSKVCFALSDFISIQLQNGGNDGWEIASIVTFLGGRFYSPQYHTYTLLTTDIDLDQMIDGDPAPGSHYSIELTKTTAS